MIHFRTILSAIGSLLLLEALLLLLTLAVGTCYGERNFIPFGLPLLTACTLGLLLRRLSRGAGGQMGRRDGFLIVSLTWVVFSLIGAMPLLLGGTVRAFAPALFETVSGFTTTGASVLGDIDHLPHSILFWRSLTHWVGGMGIVFFTIAVLPEAGSSQRLFQAESSGLKLGKLHPRISTTARWLLSLYLLLTVVCGLSLWLAGMGPFDAVNHALSTVATGGFSTHSESIAWFHSPAIEYVETVFMLLAATNFTLLYLLFFKHSASKLIHDGEFKLFVSVFAVFSLCVALVRYCAGGVGVEEALRSSFFNVISLQSSTGFTTCDFMQWPPVVWPLLLVVSVFCACAGSTSGGVKCIRLLTAWKVMRSEFRSMLHPNAVMPLRIGGVAISERVRLTVFAFFASYFCLVAAGGVVFIGMGLPVLDSVSLSISCLSNVGPTFGHVLGPQSTWGILSDGGLYVCSFLMLCGRLEIFSLLLPLVPSFWREN